MLTRCISQSVGESAEFWTWSLKRSSTTPLHSQLARTGSSIDRGIVVYSYIYFTYIFQFLLGVYLQQCHYHKSFSATMSCLICIYVRCLFAMFWCFFTITFNPFPAMPSCLNAFYQWSTDRTMFTAFTLTWKQGIFGEKVSKWSFFNLRFKFYLIVEKLAKCYNSHFGTNNVFLTEDRWKNECNLKCNS